MLVDHTDSRPLAVTLALCCVAGLMFLLGLQTLPGEVDARPAPLAPPASVISPISTGPYVDEPSAEDLRQEAVELRAAREQKRRAAINDRRLQRKRIRLKPRSVPVAPSTGAPVAPQQGTPAPERTVPPPAGSVPVQPQPATPAPQTVPASAR